MEVRGHYSGPQRQNLDIRPAKLISKSIREAFLTGLVGVIDSLSWERWSFQRGRRCDVENGAGLLGHHRSVEHRVCYEHETVDVGIVHGENVLDVEVGESCRGPQSETSLWRLARRKIFHGRCMTGRVGRALTLLMRISIWPISPMLEATASSTATWSPISTAPVTNV